MYKAQYAFNMSMIMCPAVHTATRSLLRSSSTHEPSDPLSRVKIIQFCITLLPLISTYCFTFCIEHYSCNNSSRGYSGVPWRIPLEINNEALLLVTCEYQGFCIFLTLPLIQAHKIILP